MTEEQIIEKLIEIGNEHGLETQWSLDTISPIDALSYHWPIKAKFMTDGINDNVKI